MMDSERVRESIKTCNCFTVSKNQIMQQPKKNYETHSFYLTHTHPNRTDCYMLPPKYLKFTTINFGNLDVIIINKIYLYKYCIYLYVVHFFSALLRLVATWSILSNVLNYRLQFCFVFSLSLHFDIQCVLVVPFELSSGLLLLLL